MLRGVHLSQRVVAARVAIAQQVASVAVERAIWRRVRHERQYGLAHRLQGPGWAPGCLEDIKADLAGL